MAEDESPPSKRSRPNPSSLPLKLIDDIAEDEDDPGAADDDFDPEAEAAEQAEAEAEAAAGIESEVDADFEERSSPFRERMREGGSAIALDQLRAQEEAEKLQREAEAKYGPSSSYEPSEREDYFEDLEAEEEGTGSSLQLLPSVKDPKLWLIKVDPGSEEAMVLALFKRFYEQEERHEASISASSADTHFLIHSVFTTPASKGYIYVEAEKEAHVKRAIRGLRPIKWYKMQLVPIPQMVNAVKFHVNHVDIIKGQWVRFKSGLYRGDLGQVVDLSDHNTIATVKCVPRLDFTALPESITDENGKKKRKRLPTSNAQRPPAMLFDPDAVEAAGHSLDDVQKQMNNPRDGRKYYVYRSSWLRRGFLYKDVRSVALHVENIQPTSLEAENFMQRLDGDSDEEEDEDELTAVVNDTNKNKDADANLLNIGDHIIVKEGDLQNLTGRIVDLNKNIVRIQPDPKCPIQDVLEVQPHQVKKFFALGDHVKVIAGVFKDETGMVTQVVPAEDLLSIYSDSQSREISVRAADVIESSEVSTGRESLGAYNLLDLVQLADQNVGVIVKIDVAAFRVLTQRGVVNSIKLQEIGAKRFSKYAAALDSAGNQLSREDVVVVQSGEHRHKQGTIKHVYRHFLFLHSRSVRENSGMFVVTARQAVLVGSTGRVQIGQKLDGIENVGGRINAHMRAARFGDRHPLVGKTVTITGGPYKSFIGVVKEASELSLSVELHALARKIMVQPSDVQERIMKVETGTYLGRNDFMAARTPLLGMRTPANDSSQTPALHFGGSQTPAYGSHTPSHDAWSAQTPSRSYADDDDEEAGKDEADHAWSHDYARAQDVNEEDAAVPGEAVDAAKDEEMKQQTIELNLPIFPNSAVVSWINDTGEEMTGVVLRTDDDGKVALQQVDPDNPKRLTKVEILVPRNARLRLRPVKPAKKDRIVVLTPGPRYHMQGTITGVNQQDAICMFEGNVELLKLTDLCKAFQIK